MFDFIRNLISPNSTQTLGVVVTNTGTQKASKNSNIEITIGDKGAYELRAT